MDLSGFMLFTIYKRTLYNSQTYSLHLVNVLFTPRKRALYTSQTYTLLKQNDLIHPIR